MKCTSIVIMSLALVLIFGTIFNNPHSFAAVDNGSNNKDTNNNDASNSSPTIQESKTPNEKIPITKEEIKTNTNTNTEPPKVETIIPPIDKSTVTTVTPPPSETKLDCSKTPDDPKCPSTEKQPSDSSLPKCDGSFQDCITRNGDICKAGQGGHECECLDDMSDCQNHPSLLQQPTEAITPPLVPKAEVKIEPPKTPDHSCTFFPEQAHCAPDSTGKCPSGFSLNEGEHCFPSGKCPSGFGRVNDDETGSCFPQSNHVPKLLCPPDVSITNAKHCVKQCPVDTHPQQSLCIDNKRHDNNDNHKRIIVIHRTKTIHIHSNNNPNSFVTRNTQLTNDLTVGQAIDGCKDLNKNSPNNELKKSCNIFMAATFNYCLTHQSIANKKGNICNDPLYEDNVPQYVKENVNLKLFPATIYNIVP